MFVSLLMLFLCRWIEHVRHHVVGIGYLGKAPVPFSNFRIAFGAQRRAIPAAPIVGDGSVLNTAAVLTYKNRHCLSFQKNEGTSRYSPGGIPFTYSLSPLSSGHSNIGEY